MMQVTYRLKLGQDEFELKADVQDEKEFFQTMSFYSNLPKTAPGGATDLKLVFRTTKKGHKYYSLISEKEQMEFKLGQNLEANGGGLFCKGWEKAYQSEEDSKQDEGQSQHHHATPTTVGVLTPQAVRQTQVAPPQTPQFVAPNPQFPGLVDPIVGPSAAAPMPTPMAPPTPIQTPVQNPNVTATANNVLARFGIKK